MARCLNFSERSVSSPFHQVGIGTPEHETPDGIREPAALDSQPFILQQLRSFIIGREEHIERRTILNLSIEIPAGARGNLNVVTCRFFKFHRHLSERRNKIGSHRHQYLFGQGRRHGQKTQHQGQQELCSSQTSKNFPLNGRFYIVKAITPTT